MYSLTPSESPIENRSDERLTVVVTVTADDVRESRVGTEPSPNGIANLEITFKAHEEKKVNGSIDLLSAGSSATVLSHYIGIKAPKQGGGLDALRWYFGCGAASGASIGRESPLSVGHKGAANRRLPQRLFPAILRT